MISFQDCEYVISNWYHIFKLISCFQTDFILSNWFHIFKLISYFQTYFKFITNFCCIDHFLHNLLPYSIKLSLHTKLQWNQKKFCTLSISKVIYIRLAIMVHPAQWFFWRSDIEQKMLIISAGFWHKILHICREFSQIWSQQTISWDGEIYVLLLS